MTNHSFAFRVIKQPSVGDPYNTDKQGNCKKDAFWALVRALASGPSRYFELKDEQGIEFKDEKSGVVYRIEKVEVRL